MSYLARSREREIGIRIALGASRSEVVRMILKQGLALTGGGMTIGLISAFALTGTLRTLVYGVSPADPVTFVVAPAALMAVALAAVFGPAWRASTSDPGLLLRSDG
jgi:ABC-type antimicrobial peptide transport system permease subunit